MLAIGYFEKIKLTQKAKVDTVKKNMQVFSVLGFSVLGFVLSLCTYLVFVLANTTQS